MASPKLCRSWTTADVLQASQFANYEPRAETGFFWIYRPWTLPFCFPYGDRVTFLRQRGRRIEKEEEEEEEEEEEIPFAVLGTNNNKNIGNLPKEEISIKIIIVLNDQKRYKLACMATVITSRLLSNSLPSVL